MDTLHQEPRYIMKCVSRRGKQLWAIQGVDGPDFSVFASQATAEKVLSLLLKNEAKFCDCGEWVEYKNNGSHKCICEQ